MSRHPETTTSTSKFVLPFFPHFFLPGDRGLRGPPGDKPKIPAQVMVDMKGTKGDLGNPGDRGFTGPRGLQLQPNI